LGESGFGLLQAEAREPAQGRALEALRLGLADRDANSKRVHELDPRELAGGVADEGEVAGLQRASEARVCRSLTRHEHMFACIERLTRLSKQRSGDGHASSEDSRGESSQAQLVWQAFRLGKPE
jgi:hypothetical protein